MVLQDVRLILLIVLVLSLICDLFYDCCKRLLFECLVLDTFYLLSYV